MTTVYATVEQVVARLMLLDPDTNARKVLDSDSNPSYAEVEERINAIEDYVDRITRDQWRILPSPIEYYSVDNLWPGWYPHELKTWVIGWKLQTFDGSSGDILALRRGDAWIDLLDGSHTEAIGQDYWVNYDQGIIYFYNTRPQYGEQQVKVKYRWGHEEVPHDITRAVTNLVAADLLRSEIYGVIVGAGQGFATNRMTTADRWEAEAQDILRRHTRLPSTMLGM